MIVNKNLLDMIATNYHLSNTAEDMFIENICQRYELKWVKSKIKKNSRILDLGYGDGLFLEEIAESNELTIIEGSSRLVEAAVTRTRELGINVQVVETLFEDFEPSVKFEVIIASHVLEHVDDPETLLMKMRSWLDTNGILICIVPNRESLHRRLGLKMGLINKLEELSARDHVVGHQRVYSFADLKNDLNKSGYEIKEARGFFTKALANSQMLDLDEEVIWGLCQLSDELPMEMGANLGVIARSQSKLISSEN